MSEDLQLTVLEHRPGVSEPASGQFFNVAYFRKNIIQWLIYLVTGNKFTHSGIVGERLPNGDYVIYEAYFSGFRENRLSYYDGIAEVEFSDFQLTQVERRAIIAEAKRFIGIGYSYGAILALLLSSRGFCPQWIFRKLADPRNLICSEAVARAYYNAGLPFKLGIDFARMTPGDLSRYLAGETVRR